jgi:hypothetical protein
MQMMFLEKGRDGSSHFQTKFIWAVRGAQNIYVFGRHINNHHCNSKVLVITRISMVSAVI